MSYASVARRTARRCAAGVYKLLTGASGIPNRVFGPRRRKQMTRLLLLCGSGLAIAACAPQEPPPPPPAAAPPAGYATGSPAAVTTFYDGTYEGNFVQQITAGNPNVQCPNYRVAPSLTIRNGVARFAALDLDFQGYVTPRGELRAQAAT